MPISPVLVPVKALTTQESAPPEGRGAFVEGKLGELDRCGLGALLALGHLELHALALFKAAVSGGLDGRVVGEQILRSVVGGDEAETLFGVEPLDGSSGHSLLLSVLLSSVVRS